MLVFKIDTMQIEAKANKAGNDMLISSLTQNILKFNEIQAFIKLATSPNAKRVITDDKGSLMNILDNK